MDFVIVFWSPTLIQQSRAPPAGASLRIMSYVIFGRKVANEYLALGTFALTGAIATLATSGGDKKAKDPKQEAPITASSSDEESFIRDFVAKMEREEAGQKH